MTLTYIISDLGIDGPEDIYVTMNFHKLIQHLATLQDSSGMSDILESFKAIDPNKLGTYNLSYPCYRQLHIVEVEE